MVSNKLVLLTFLLALITTSPPSTHARPTTKSSSTSVTTLMHRLKLDEQGSNCWDSLVQLQACSSELILFFLNGETYIGDGCCEAIRTIGNQCWPNMLGTIGFTSDEGDVLQEYCDGEVDEEAFKSLAP